VQPPGTVGGGPDATAREASLSGLDGATAPDAGLGPVRSLTVTVTATGSVPLPVGSYVDVDRLHQGLVDAANAISWPDVPSTPLTVVVTAPDCSQATQGIDATTTSLHIELTCTPVGVDAIDLSQASVYNSPPDIAAWSDTTAITELDFTSSGVHVTFDKSSGPNRWPDVTPPGWSGPLQYTLWLVLNVGGQWDTSGIVQFWYGLSASGGDVTQGDQIAVNWVYDGRWGPMEGHQPAVGELVGFFVAAGNERGVTDTSQAPVVERSNVVVVPFPATAGASFVFGPQPDAGAVMSADAGPSPCGYLGGGSSLASGGALASCDGRFSLAMQGDGNLVLYFGATVLWSTGTAGNGGATLSMQTDGNLVVYSSADAALWSSGTAGNAGASLALQTDGNLVVYSAADVAVWSSQTGGH